MDKEFHKIIRDRKEISVRYDTKAEAIWVYANPKIRPCYSLTLLEEVYELQLSIIEYFKESDMKPKTPVKYYLNASQTPNIYNYGGDSFVPDKIEDLLMMISLSHLPIVIVMSCCMIEER